MPDKKLTDNEIKRQAPFICCPMCDEEKCVGRNNCLEIKNFVEQRIKEREKVDR